MERQRSISDSCGGARSLSRRVSSLTFSPASGSQKLQSTSVPSTLDKESSKAALTEVIKSYKFIGKIISWKSKEEYGFIRSEQISSCDVFFSHFHIHSQDLNKSKAGGNLGKLVQFQVEDVGRKNMEGRNVLVVEAEAARPQYLTGVLAGWVKSGCLIQVNSDANLAHNRIFAPHQECGNLKNFPNNVSLTFRIQMDKSFRVEARDVSVIEPVKVIRSKNNVKSHSKSDVTTDTAEETIILKDFTSEEFSKELIKKVGKMGPDLLDAFFEKNVKQKFTEFVQQPIAAKVIVAVICRVAQTGGGKLEEKITRMMRADLMSISSGRQGCAVLQTALEKFSRPRKVLLAEQLAELGAVEDFTCLWTHGSQLFINMLQFMEDSSLSTIGLTLLGNYSELACHVGHYKPVRALILQLVNTEVFSDILQEIDLVEMSCDRFGHHITIALLESVPHAVKDELIKSFQGKIAALSVDPVCSSVIVACVRSGSAKQQAELIEEVCTVSSKQADMDVAKLIHDRFGHEVVLVMLEVSRHKHIHNVLKGDIIPIQNQNIPVNISASVLCKHEEILENEFALKVYKAIKTEFHAKISGNYPKSH